MSMLRDLDRRDAMSDVVHVHSARTARTSSSARSCGPRGRRPGYRLHLQLTGEAGRLAPATSTDLRGLARRETFASGPGEMLDALTAHWETTPGRGSCGWSASSR